MSIITTIIDSPFKDDQFLSIHTIDKDTRYPSPPSSTTMSKPLRQINKQATIAHYKPPVNLREIHSTRIAASKQAASRPRRLSSMLKEWPRSSGKM
jgi:hypothetical protein